MRANQRSLDTIATNLANLGTTGFKRTRTAEHAFELPTEHGRVRGLQAKDSVDFRQGELDRTGRALDVALFGEGFFAVEAGESGEAYTRDGVFHMDERGTLVSDDGHQVAWDSLTGTIDPVGLPVEIDGEGFVRQGDTEVGRLRIVNFEDPSRLSQDRHGYWRAPNNLREVAHTAVVHQGALEQSNATGMEEMVAMIAVQRSFESVANVMSSIEDSYSRLTQPY